MLFDLTKSAKNVFAKKGLNFDLSKPKAMDVVVALDVSGSMKDLFMSGKVQETLTKLFAVATLLDEDKQLDVWVFDNASTDLTEHMTENNYENYVKDIILKPSVDKWGGTYYAGVMKDIVESYYEKKLVEEKESKTFLFFTKKEQVYEYVSKTGKPVMVLFITDGVTSHPAQAEEIVANNKQGIYWNFIGVGAEHFTTLENIANKYDNAGFVKLISLNLTDTQLYDKILTTEVVNFIGKYVSK